MSDAHPLLEVRDLRVAYPSRDRSAGSGWTEVVRGVGFSLGRERLGIVGESGSGKSQTGRAILGLTAPGGRVTAATLKLGDIDLLACSERERRALRGGRIAMVLQDPKYALNPVLRVGQQIEETWLAHAPAGKRGGRTERRERVAAALREVGIDDPARVMRLYPHEVSGGMGQRVMIAMMLIAEPELLIADEPTSALDVSVQLQVLAVLDRLVAGRGMGLIFVSHDLRLVQSFCDRVLVMYAGRVVEECRACDLDRAQHPYTRGLLSCLPELGGTRRPLPVLDRKPEWASETAVSR
ncbi:MAG: ABC transporter ATP-binding protein [Rubrivivax sp.]